MYEFLQKLLPEMWGYMSVLIDDHGIEVTYITVTGCIVTEYIEIF